MPLRLAVIGAQTAAPESPKPYTVYRTIATLDGQCYERLLRFSHFYVLNKKIKLKSGRLQVKFPSKTWSRRASMEDEVIEARQVLLNEFVKELSKKELHPKSEDFLFKMLKIGKYDDGSGRVSDISSYMPTASTMKSDRGTLDVLREVDEERDDDVRDELGLGGAATLSAMTCTVPVNITSNATTVLTEDERSAVRPTSEEEESAMLAEQDAIAADAQANHNTATAAPRKAASIPPSAYSGMMLQRPALKTAQSMPVRRSHHVDFASPAPRSSPALTSFTATATPTPQQDGSLSPEKRYRDLIDTQLSTINRLLSESEEAEAAMPLSIARPNTSLALTA